MSSKADIYPLAYDFSNDGLIAEISILGQSVNISTTLIGRHNLYNVLASISATFLYGVSLEKIASSLNKPIHIPGRLEIIYNKNG